MHAEAIAQEIRENAASTLRVLQGMRFAIPAAFDKDAAARANELQEQLVRQIRGDAPKKQNVKQNRRTMVQRIKGLLGRG